MVVAVVGVIVAVGLDSEQGSGLVHGPGAAPQHGLMLGFDFEFVPFANCSETAQLEEAWLVVFQYPDLLDVYCSYVQCCPQLVLVWAYPWYCKVLL